MKSIILTLYFILCHLFLFSQTKSETIINQNKTAILKRMNELNIKEVNSIYLRVFKYESIMQLWIRSENNWHLYKTYDICGKSGMLGRKMITNDKQIPEGIYQITQLNVNSQYHLSLKINYPNKADYFYSDSTKPGDEIFIHGGCASIGCVAILNQPVEEVWTLVHMVKNRNIPVHIFSIQFDQEKSNRVLQTFAYTKEDFDFQDQMRKIFFYWEWNKKIPNIIIDKKGNYVIEDHDGTFIQKWSQ